MGFTWTNSCFMEKPTKCQKNKDPHQGSFGYTGQFLPSKFIPSIKPGNYFPCSLTSGFLLILPMRSTHKSFGRQKRRKSYYSWTPAVDRQLDVGRCGVSPTIWDSSWELPTLVLQEAEINSCCPLVRHARPRLHSLIVQSYNSLY